MPIPFPGMDPYLERRSLWRGVHTQLIVDLARAINRQVRPRYTVSIEERSYVTLSNPNETLGVPDVMVVHPKGGQSQSGRLPSSAVSTTMVSESLPILVELPMPEEVIERYIEIHEVVSGEVITAIELLSPKNKSDKIGREAYREKRTKLLGSKTHLVEIDLLRAGEPMDMVVPKGRSADYRIIVSRSHQRPHSDLYLFGIRTAIPAIPIPLQRDEPEPVIDLNLLVHELYDSLNYDLKIDYRRPSDPPIKAEDAAWVESLLREKGLRIE